MKVEEQLREQNCLPLKLALTRRFGLAKALPHWPHSSSMSILSRSGLRRQWTRRDSNSESLPCQGSVFPLHHGPGLRVPWPCRRKCAPRPPTGQVGVCSNPEGKSTPPPITGEAGTQDQPQSRCFWVGYCCCAACLASRASAACAAALASHSEAWLTAPGRMPWVAKSANMWETSGAPIALEPS